MDGNISAALRRFPSQKETIERLSVCDEAFRSLCEDLADAEDALRKWEQSDSPKRDQRCSEFRELVDDLAKEVETALTDR